MPLSDSQSAAMNKMKGQSLNIRTDNSFKNMINVKTSCFILRKTIDRVRLVKLDFAKLSSSSVPVKLN